ncbi:MAG: hypothetical protein DRJ40_11435 [Thermoprotei archaeon]|nr:MAG: hypothetical protein DRJ40_11435 [Thermoprotei archaeon]
MKLYRCAFCRQWLSSRGCVLIPCPACGTKIAVCLSCFVKYMLPEIKLDDIRGIKDRLREIYSELNELEKFIVENWDKLRSELPEYEVVNGRLYCEQNGVKTRVIANGEEITKLINKLKIIASKYPIDELARLRELVNKP